MTYIAIKTTTYVRYTRSGNTVYKCVSIEFSVHDDNPKTCTTRRHECQGVVFDCFQSFK